MKRHKTYSSPITQNQKTNSQNLKEKKKHL
jgi:hypothetical protein